ncbi:MAG: HIT family protein [Gammaproteobacteria bacterium]|nr:MAG: HIT family protein [Gammaproteobacteria bacterium]
MTACVFCDVVAKEAPASVVYEDSECIVIMDIFPVRVGHTLVISKQHAQHLRELSPFHREHLFDVANRVTVAQSRCGIPFDASNLIVNDGKAANQHVPHVHIHLIPRTKKDTLAFVSSFFTRMLKVFGEESKRKRLDRTAQRIKRQLEMDWQEKKSKLSVVDPLKALK